MPPDHLAQIRPIYWNPIRTSETCSVCTRPVEAPHERCYKCANHYYSGHPLANVVAPLTYAPKGSQAMTDTYSYKASSAEVNQGARNRLFGGLVREAIRRHAACFRDLSPAPIAIATVPSSRGQVDHPLEHGLRMFSTPRVRLRYVGPAELDHQARRVFDPGRWQVLDNPKGLHILLFDDTWVTGAHVQSCASVLQSAGAAFVSAVPIARHLDLSSPTPAFLEAHRRRIYDPAVCPISGDIHP